MINLDQNERLPYIAETHFMLEKITEIVYEFFINSSDFNGIPLRQISEDLKIGYQESIDFIKVGVRNEELSIQSSTNPHIIGFQEHEISNQLAILENAKTIEVQYETFGEITFSMEQTEYPICVYPSLAYLRDNRNLNDFGDQFFTKKLAQGEPQLSLVYFDIEVLERYAIDPRYNFSFNDYSGNIYCKYDEDEKPLVRDEDELFLKSFGLGYGENRERLAVVPLCYLKDLSEDQQQFWKSKIYKKKGRVAEDYYNNIILGQWTFSHSVFSAFIGEQNCLNELAKKIFGKPLFRNIYDAETRPREFTPYFTPTLKNYLDFVSLTDKMISDNINKDFFAGKIELDEVTTNTQGVTERRQKGTLSLLQEWLIAERSTDGAPGIQKLCGVFRKVRKERQTPAHKITQNEYDLKYYQMQIQLIEECYHAMRALRYSFADHQDATGVEIPKWLDEGRVILP